jgi:hypothetical protein
MIHRASSPHALRRFERAAPFARGLQGEARARFTDPVHRTGGQQMMSIRLARPLKRENYALLLR